MRHRKARLQLNRFTSWRKATLKSLARSVIIHQSIKTTKVKAQAVQPLLEKLINMARTDTLKARRRAFAILGDHKLVNRLFTDIAARFKERAGGYTRIMSVASRRGDNAEVVILELTEIKKKEPPSKKEAKESRQKTPQEEKAPEAEKAHEAPPQEHKPKSAPPEAKEKPDQVKKEQPQKKFLGGLRNIFKKERDAL